MYIERPTFAALKSFETEYKNMFIRSTCTSHEWRHITIKQSLVYQSEKGFSSVLKSGITQLNVAFCVPDGTNGTNHVFLSSRIKMGRCFLPVSD